MNYFTSKTEDFSKSCLNTFIETGTHVIFDIDILNVIDIGVTDHTKKKSEMCQGQSLEKGKLKKEEMPLFIGLCIIFCNMRF